MKTTKEILTGKKSSYKIIDFYGNIIAKGFRNKSCARNELPRLKIHKGDKLEIVEE